MNANVNSVTSLLPDLSASDVSKTTPSERNNPKDDVESKKESFSQALNQAQKKEAPAKVKDRQKGVRSLDSKEPSQEVTAQSASLEQPKKAMPVPVENAENPALEKHAPIGIDDRAGTISESYEGMAVSYPVSRIAKESLDDETIKSIKDQGLWEMPSLVMAQPSQQLLLMKNAMEGQPSAVEAVPMAKPIAQFMASLENELGVTPDRLVQAFKKLPPGALQLAPEKTMAQVVKNLNLDPKDQAQAQALFAKMLSQMQTLHNESMDPALLAMAGMPAETAAVPGEKVNETAVTKSRVQNATTKYVQQAPEKTSSRSVVREPIAESPKSAFDSSLKEKAIGQNPQEQTVKAEPKLAPEAQSDVKPMPFYTPKAETVVPADTTPTPASQVALQTHSAQPDVFSQTMNTNTMDDKNFKSIAKGFKDTKSDLTVKGPEATSTTPVNSAVSSTDLASVKSDSLGATAVAGTGIGATELKSSNDSKHEAIRSIVNQAQMLAAKGGGEMRMSLKPEHLGEIQLKVAMEGNRVNVQMTAERGEVKKLIEQNVHELRHGLASHNLSMDKLDVSVGNKDTQGFSRGQPDFGAARDFSNQFHQQNSRREMMEDLGAIRGNALKSMGTMDRAAQATQAMGARKTEGRLNVVA